MLIVLLAKNIGLAWTWFIGLAVLTNMIVALVVDRIIAMIHRPDHEDE